ncbi:MAG: glycyl-radical enzyme activating protein [Phycisphaerae bacterium]|nr:glycyl-radical enzyme activating protein [Phycisphaerae bacterium]
MSRLDVRGIIFDIKRFAIHDGPGIRTTVFCKGCPLNCAWCHNPESIRPDPEISLMPDRCIGCGHCFKICQQHAHRMNGDKRVYDRDRCVVCGDCAEKCYAEAIEIVGRQVTVAEVIQEVEADRPFYETSRGGMTLSGGEPTQQFDFTHALLAEAKLRRLHTCLDTSGLTSWDRLDQLLPLVDIFLYDLKDTDAQRHKRFTGVDNDLILENLRRLNDAGAEIILRCPMIPGINIDDQHLTRIADVVRSHPRISEVNLLPYHRLGMSKSDRMGYDRPKLTEQTPAGQEVEEWLTRLRDLGVTTARRS